MKRKFKYDPEDLESLLLNKKFEELYPEEKDFVLKHMESAEEYASMRKTLLSIVDHSESGHTLKPKNSTKKALLREFESERAGGWWVWLNTAFLPFSRRPVLSYSTLAVLLIAGVLFFFNRPETDKVLLADNKELTKEKEDEKKPVEEATQSEKNENEDNSSEPLKELPQQEENETKVLEKRQAEVANDSPGREESLANNADQRELDLAEEPEVAEDVELSTKDFVIEEGPKEVAEKTQVEADEIEKTEELAESVEPQLDEVVVNQRSVTAAEVQSNSFTMDDQVGNVSETTTIERFNPKAKRDVQLKSTSMAKASFLLSKLHTSM